MKLAMRCSCAVILFAALGVRAETPTASSAPPDQPENVLERVFRFDTQVAQALHEVRGERDEDPLRFLAGDMTGIMGDLSRYMTDKPVQIKEEKVVGELDYLIKLLEKQCGGSGSGSPLNPTRPRADSILANGPGGINDLHDPKAGEKMWGNLPPKQREQILQSKTEGFPPGFESILQSYFMRLAQEHAGEDASDARPAPTTRPAAP